MMLCFFSCAVPIICLHAEPYVLVTPEPPPAVNNKDSNCLFRAVMYRSSTEFAVVMCEISLTLSLTRAIPHNLMYS